MPGERFTKRGTLANEAVRLGVICRRIGKRLRKELDETEGMPLSALSPEWRDDARWYSHTVTTLLREQRERIKLATGDGVPQMTEAEYRAEVEAMVRESVRTMPAEQLQALLAERAPVVDVEPEPGPEPLAMPFVEAHAGP